MAVINLNVDASADSFNYRKKAIVGEEKLCQARLTLESGVPISQSDQLAKTSLYLTPYNGNNLDLYNVSQAKWNRVALTEQTLTNAGLAKNRLYDVFASNSSLAPVLDWRFSTDTGLTVPDFSPSGNDGTVGVDGYKPTWNSAGKFEGCYLFGPVYKTIKKTTAVGLPVGSSARTMCGWIKYRGYATDPYLFGYGSENVANNGFWVNMTDSGYIGFTAITNGRQWGWVPDTAWHHVAVVLPAGKTKISEALFYFDGELKTTSAVGSDADFATSNTNFTAGSNLTLVRGFDGYLDSLKVFAVPLSGTQIAELASQENLSEDSGLILSLEAWNAPTGGAITAISDATPRVASTLTPPDEGSLITIEGDAGEATNNATWRVGAVVAGTSFVLLNLDGTDSSDPANPGTASSFTQKDGIQGRISILDYKDGKAVMSTDEGKLYLGTVKVTDEGKFEDSKRFRGVWNYYNKVKREVSYYDAVGCDILANTTDVPNGFVNMLYFVVGLVDRAILSIAGFLVTPGPGSASFYAWLAINSHTDAVERIKVGGNTIFAGETVEFCMCDLLQPVDGGNYINCLMLSSVDDTHVSNNSVKVFIEG
jgi:hypothetical protein